MIGPHLDIVRNQVPQPEQTTDPHPYYLGGCDALGPGGTCAACAEAATLAPIHIIEFSGDGNAIIRRTDDSETMMMAMDVPEFLLNAARLEREARYGG